MLKLYDNIINNFKKQFSGYESKSLQVSASGWPLVTDRSMILRSDMAFELGGNSSPAKSHPNYGLGITLVTEDDTIVTEDAITLCGEDLNAITSDCNYARVALIRVKKDMADEGNALYNAIRKLEYTRFHFYPEGFMMRVSTSQNKESVRVSKEAIKKGLNFTTVGSLLIDAFHKNEIVDAVHIYYITNPEFPYELLENASAQSEAITKTIDHILKDVKMDCNICSLKPVCDEVEGLRELHFKK